MYIFYEEVEADYCKWEKLLVIINLECKMRSKNKEDDIFTHN